MTKNFEFWQIMEIQIMNVTVLNLTNNSNDDDDRYCKIKQLNYSFNCIFDFQDNGGHFLEVDLQQYYN